MANERLTFNGVGEDDERAGIEMDAVETSEGGLALPTAQKDQDPESSGYRENIGGINHTNAIILDLAGKKITKYRFISTDADIRVAEDVTDQTEADSWLQAGVTPLADGQLFCHREVLANEYSTVRKFPRGRYLTNVAFLADKNVSGKTVDFEGE